MSPPKQIKTSSAPKKNLPAAKIIKGGKNKNSRLKSKDFTEESEIVETISTEEANIGKRAKEDMWLDKLPPVIKEDEGIHIQKSKERKEKEKQKKYFHCKMELLSIINFSFAKLNKELELRSQPSFSISKLERENRRIRCDYIRGEFYPEISNKSALPSTPVSRTYTPRKQQFPSIDSVINLPHIDIGGSYINLMKIASKKSSFQFDGNGEIDTLLCRLNNEMQLYKNPQPHPNPVHFPFLICITGPPCSGKTTIASYITEYFKVVILNVFFSEGENNSNNNKIIDIRSSDEKVILSTILSKIEEVPAEHGVIIVNYPLNKSQFAALEKGIQSITKQKSEGNLKLSTISAIFRTSMSIEEAEAASSGRMIDQKTGYIYHKEFNPPTTLELSSFPDIIDLPSSEIGNSYSRILQATSFFESLNKKGTTVVSIGKYDHIEKLYLQIENTIRHMFDSHSISPPFTSFVHIRNHQKLLFAKQCYDMFEMWEKRCIPQFAQTLTDIYSRSKAIHDKIKYLEQSALNRFVLVLSQPDERPSISLKMRNDIMLFDHIWNFSIDIRDSRINEVDEIIKESGFEMLLKALDESDQSLFESLFTRFYLAQWFYNEFSKVSSERILDSIPIPIIPAFDINNMSQAFEYLNVNSVIPQSMQHSSLLIENGESRSILDIIQFALDKFQSVVLKNDAKLMIDVMDFLHTEKNGLECQIRNVIQSLQKTMKDWVSKKYVEEMELFSCRFRSLPTIPIDEPLFRYCYGFIGDGFQDFYPRLAGKYSYSDLNRIPIDKINSFVKRISLIKNETMTVDDVLSNAKVLAFSQLECEILETVVRMSFIPGYVNMKELGVFLAPTEEMAKSFEEMFKKTNK